MINVKIMIVDDIGITRRALKDVLVDGCDMNPERIFEAANGSEAISLYQKHKPDIVFLDITMPDYDGKTVVKELIKIDPHAQIIMFTGSGEKMDVVECIRAGAKDYVRKPPRADRVQKALDKIMNGK